MSLLKPHDRFMRFIHQISVPSSTAAKTFGASMFKASRPFRLLYFIALAGLLCAQTTDPITDRLRFEIAAAQRDYLIAKQQYEAAAAQLKAKIEQADKACGGRFDSQSFACVEKPK